MNKSVEHTHSEERARLNKFISACELQRWADNKYRARVFLAGPRPSRGRIAIMWITMLTNRTCWSGRERSIEFINPTLAMRLHVDGQLVSGYYYSYNCDLVFDKCSSRRY